MTIALVQQVAVKTALGGAAGKTVTIATPGAGNALRLLVGRATTTVVNSVTGGGVTWSLLATIDNSNSSHSTELWGGDNSSGSGTTITITLANTYTQVEVNVSEWSGLDTTPVQDPAPGTNTGTSNTATTDTVTPTAGKEVLLLASAVHAATLTDSPSGGFTALTRSATATGYGFAYQIVASASGNYLTTWGLSAAYNPWATIIAGWDAAGGGGGGLSIPIAMRHYLQMMGVG